MGPTGVVRGGVRSKPAGVDVVRMSRRRRSARTARRVGLSAYGTAANVVLTGIVVIVPLVITLYILSAALGFETNRSPASVQSAANVDGMTTLFLPLAPNPVMGGFLAHIPDENVHDVEMSVETAVSHVITSGIATDEPSSGGFREVTDGENRGISGS